MTNESGHDTTPKLQRLLVQHRQGEDTVKQVIPYAKKGYPDAQEILIDAAEKGSGLAQSTLLHILLSDENPLDLQQAKRAILASVTEQCVRQKLLQKKADEGHQWALRTLCDLTPKGAEHTDLLGAMVQESVLDTIGGEKALWTKEQLRRDAQQLEAELLSEGNSPLERTLIRRIVVCYLTAQSYEFTYSLESPRHINFRTHSLLLQRMNQAHDRYMSAIRTLAQVRKMKLPNLQVNIADKQINVA